MRIDWLDEDEWGRFRSIRLASLLDAAEAFGTRHEDLVLMPEPGWREQLRRLPTFVASLDERDVGVVRAVEHADLDDAAYLISMWVHPEYRRRDVGSALIDRVIDWTREMCRSRLFLDVRTQVVEAQRLYRAKGFAPTGVEIQEGAFTEVQMVRDC